MNKTTKALKLMMEALEMQIHGAGSIIHSKLAWQAGQEALAEPEPLTMRLDIEASKVKTMTLEEYKEFMQPVKQEPVAEVEITYGREPECYVTGNIDDFPEGVFKLYAAPVSAKREWVDMTDDEIGNQICQNSYMEDNYAHALDFAWAVIAAFKEKNK